MGVLPFIAGRTVTESTGRTIAAVASERTTRPPPINRTNIDATITESTKTSITARFRSSDRADPFVPVLSRRRFPNGTLLTETTGPRIESPTALDRRLTIPIDDDDPRSIGGPWVYTLAARTTDRSSERYLCESDPVGNGSRYVPENVPLPLRNDDEPFERRDYEGRYELRFQWSDGNHVRWSLSHAVSKSAFARARTRRRGYVKTFLEALTNPQATHLTSRLVTNAVPVHRSHVDPPTEATLFDRVVRFVQSFRYVADEESMGSYDYHRTIEESLVDGVRDCKDGTYLLAGLLAQPPFEYETALVLMADHMFLGVHRDDLPAAYADLETVRDSPYVGIETTRPRSIGDYGTDPIVAIFGPSSQFVDAEATADAIGVQLEKFADYYT